MHRQAEDKSLESSGGNVTAVGVVPASMAFSYALLTGRGLDFSIV